MKTSLLSLFFLFFTAVVLPAQVSWVSTGLRFTEDAADIPTLGRTLSLNGWRGETVMAQIAVNGMQGGSDNAEDPVVPESFRIRFRGSLPESGFEIGQLGYVVADGLNPDGSGCGYRPDHSLFDSLMVADWIRIPDKPVYSFRPAGKTGFLWVEYAIPADMAPGRYRADLDFLQDGRKFASLRLNLLVEDPVLPPASQWKFHLDLWQNPYAVARIENVPLWSDAHFEAMRPLMQRLAKAGQKVVTATLCDRPWDGQTEDEFKSMVRWTRRLDGSWDFGFEVFDRWVEFMEECGISRQINCYSMIPWAMNFKYFDLSANDVRFISGGPGNPAYDEAWTALLKAFAAHLREKGWMEKVCIAMDERPMETVRRAMDLVQQADPAFKFSTQGYFHPEIEPMIHDYCVNYDGAFPTDVLARRKAEGKVSTYYTCCTEGHPNTFTFSAPSEAAELPVEMVARGADGYLRWAYNSWTESPFTDSRFRTWASGDCYLVYPGNVSSVRFEKLFEGIQQAEKLALNRRGAVLEGGLDADPADGRTVCPEEQEPASIL